MANFTRYAPSELIKSLQAGTRAGAYYITIKGQKQGPFPGSSYAKGFESTIEVIEWSHLFVSPRDMASGMATGKREHYGLRCVGKADKSTPYLFNALSTNENLPEVTLKCYSQVKAGKASTSFWNHYTVKLTNANVSYLEHACSPLDASLLIDYSFTYRAIEISEQEGNATAMDDWESPVA